MNYRYEIRWTQRRNKTKQLLPRRVVASCREVAIRLLADALKGNTAGLGRMPARISITLGLKDKGPSRVEWMKA